MMRRGIERIAVLALVMATALPALLGAQVIGGVVRDAVTSAPVSGAVVMLLGANRDPLARGITSSSGSFRLSADNAALLRVIRIGYTPYEQRVESTAGTALAIGLVPLGRNLRPIAINTQPVCPSRRDKSEALAIWASATDGMLAMTVASTEQSQGGAVKQLLYNRLLDNAGRRIVRQSTERVITQNASPIRADRDPEEFVASGYVLRNGDVTSWYGPDPEVLLDSTFAATHCLSIQHDARAHPGEIGVAFTPTSNRASVPDIAGVLWLTRSPMALKSLTFEYRGVDRSILNMRAGGRLDFETLANGVPIIRSWTVRSPRVGYQRVGRFVDQKWTLDSSRAIVLEIHETGGLITGGRLTDGTVLTAPLATLGGRVLQVRTGQPSPGARVTLDSTDQVSIADRDGQFSFEEVLPGPYTLRARDSVMIRAVTIDSAGQIVPDTSVRQIVRRTSTMAVEARIGHVTPIDLRMPWRDVVGGCTAAFGSELRFVVLGIVVTPGDEPIRNARVALRWADTVRGSTVETEMEGVTDEGGGFLLCGLPAEVPLAARVTAAGIEFRGTIKVSRVDYDEQGRPRRGGSLRTIRVVVTPVR
ncbi:MAG TPA: carboxypeptidase regulatory-like domain-containing protein [Gemmatimonadaceae bacterium]